MKKQHLVIIFFMFVIAFIISGMRSKGMLTKINIETPIVKVENSEKGVLISWNEISEVDGYKVYRKPDAGKYQEIANVAEPNVTEYIDENASAATLYYYMVRAYKGERRSEYEAVDITTGIWEPEVNLEYSEGGISVSWNPISGCEGYMILKMEEGGKYSLLTTIDNPETNSYIDEEIIPGKVYVYTVRSYIGEMRSSYTGKECATIGQPKIEVVKANESVRISWKPVEEAEGYYVYRKQQDGTYERIANINNKNRGVYIDHDVVVGSKYWYVVRAYLREQQSAYSPLLTKELQY